MLIPALTLWDWLLVGGLFVQTFTVGWGVWTSVYPPTKQALPVGVIEEAVVIYTWREAISLYQKQLRWTYTLLLVTGLMVVS